MGVSTYLDHLCTWIISNLALGFGNWFLIVSFILVTTLSNRHDHRPTPLKSDVTISFIRREANPSEARTSVRRVNLGQSFRVPVHGRNASRNTSGLDQERRRLNSRQDTLVYLFRRLLCCAATNIGCVIPIEVLRVFLPPGGQEHIRYQDSLSSHCIYTKMILLALRFWDTWIGRKIFLLISLTKIS